MTTEAELINRLDKLPFTKKHRKILFGAGLGWAFDAMDVGLITYIIAVLTQQWGLTPTQQSLIVSAGFVGMTLGAILGGGLADRVGRRTVFTMTLIIYGVATGASAFVGGVLPLIILRILVGLGLGAELPIASTLVAEVSPKRLRGSITVWLEAFWALGWTLAALVGYFVVPLGDNGWRWAFAIGALPAFYAIIVRWGLPESVRFLLRKGRVDEAATVVESLEESAGPEWRRTQGAGSGAMVHSGSSQVADATTDEVTGKPSLTTLFSTDFRKRTFGIWTVWFMVNFAYYGAFIWIPSILHASGHSLVKSFGFTLIITLAQLPGYAAASYFIEKWGRRPTLTTFLIGSAVAAIGFGLADSSTSIIAAGCLLSFFNLGAWGALYAITPEVYPTFVRGTGAGWAAGFGRIASIVAPFAVTALLAVGGVEGGNKPLLFVVLASAFAIAAVATFALPERRGESLN
ncbi:MAG: MFS transporter [Ancrocorticia sp.]